MHTRWRNQIDRHARIIGRVVSGCYAVLASYLVGCYAVLMYVFLATGCYAVLAGARWSPIKLVGVDTAKAPSVNRSAAARALLTSYVIN